MHVVGAVVLGVWIAFWVFWLAASFRVKTGRTRWARFAGVRVALVLAVLLAVRAGGFRSRAITADPWSQGVGLAVLALGVALAVWARLCLGRNWGMPMSEKVDPELVTTGPYRSIRHPIYSGILLGAVGTAVAVSLVWLLAAAVLGAYFVYSAVVEERHLALRLPEAYPAYRRATKMLIPFVL